MRIGAFAAGLALLAIGGPARPQAGDEIENKIINRPPAAAHRVDGGAKGDLRNDPKVQWGKALRISVPGKSDKAWSTAIANPIEKPVKAGDRLLLAFWARLEKGDNGAATANLPYNAVQLASDPYTPLFSGGVTIGSEWNMHEVKGKADKDYPAGALNVAIHLATGKQTVDIGPVFVLNLGQ